MNEGEGDRRVRKIGIHAFEFCFKPVLKMDSLALLDKSSLQANPFWLLVERLMMLAPSQHSLRAILCPSSHLVTIACPWLDSLLPRG